MLGLTKSRPIRALLAAVIASGCKDFSAPICTDSTAPCAAARGGSKGNADVSLAGAVGDASQAGAAIANTSMGGTNAFLREAAGGAGTGGQSIASGGTGINVQNAFAGGVLSRISPDGGNVNAAGGGIDTSTQNAIARGGFGGTPLSSATEPPQSTVGFAGATGGTDYGVGGAPLPELAGGSSVGGNGSAGAGADASAGAASTTYTPPAEDTSCGSTAEGCPLTASSVIGTWHLNLGGGLVALLNIQTSNGALTGSLTHAGVVDPIDGLSLDSSGKWLMFRDNCLDGVSWYRVAVADRVLHGRYSKKGTSSKAPDMTEYLNHVTGWREANPFAGQPLVYDVHTEAGTGIANHRMRLTRGSAKGRFKEYRGSWGEGLENAVVGASWQADSFSFLRILTETTVVQTYTGTFYERKLEGIINGLPYATWNATPVQVLSYGLEPRGELGAEEWRAAARRDLFTLTMAGGPKATLLGADVQARTLIPSEALPAERDDDAANHSQGYDLKEITWIYRHRDRFTQVEVDRHIHGYVATPFGVPPASGFPLAVVLNGHGGSAYQLFEPSNARHWYGDAFARRGYTVIGVDISHRGDSAPDALLGGDDPVHGNAEHPAMVPPGVAEGWTTDWEEDGERAWDAMRAIDYAESRTDVDLSRVTMVGLELGGEVALLAAALDERVGVTVVAGYAPDLGVLRQTSAHPCFEWRYADQIEYFDTSDLMALIAPRALIVETGVADTSSSLRDPPFSSAKQAVFRARRAYADANVAGRLVHYLHDGTLRFRVGERSVDGKLAIGVRVSLLIQPAATPSADSELWQVDSSTQVRADSLFSLIEELHE